MPNSRIPDAPDEFNNYLHGGDDYLNDPLAVPLNWTRLLLTLIIAGWWHTQRLAWDILYTKYADPLKVNGPIRTAVHLFIKTFKITASLHLDTMAACTAATSDDEAKFNFVKDSEHADPTHHVDGIEDEIFSRIAQKGGGKMKTGGYTSTSAKRAGCPPDKGIDSVKRYWALSTTATNGPANYNSPGVVSEVKTGASTVMELGAENGGQYLNYWDQWFDTKNTKRGGPISSRQVKLIV